MSGTTVVFCGPTIDRATVLERLGHDGVVCLPPVAQGDVLRAVRVHAPTRIAIIDGVFERVPAVWHKEILWAIEQGVAVFGAASMGALRAAELHPFGMVGVGEVFEQFRDGRLVDDDEVAVAHADAGDDHRPLSTAMVDIRDRAVAAVAAGVLTETAAAALVDAAKALPYRDRSLPSAARAAGLDADEVAALRRFDAGAGPGRKRRDALALLDVLAAADGADAAPPAERPWFVEPTVFLAAALFEVDQELSLPVGGDGGDLPPVDPGLVGTTEPVLRKQALLRLLAHEVGRLRGIRLDHDAVAGVVANFRRRYGLEDDAALAGWLDRHGLRWDDALAALVDIAMVDRVEQAYRLAVDAGVAPLARFSTARRASVDHLALPPHPWVAFDLALPPTDKVGHAAAVLDAVEEALATVPEGARGWFFQRKPPDVRLRIEVAPGHRGAVDDAVRRALVGAVAGGTLVSFAPAAYEPEAARFGGEPAMTEAHAHFAADTLLWRQALRAIGPGAPALQLTFLHTARSIATSLPDLAPRDEVAAALGREAADPSGDTTVRALGRSEDLEDLDERVAAALGPEAPTFTALLARAMEAARACATAPTPAGDASVAPAARLALLLHFSANRWGFDGPAQRWLADWLARR